MPTPNLQGRNVLERTTNLREMEKTTPRRKSSSPSSKHLQRVYPLSMHRSSSSFSTVSSLSVSQNSNDSSQLNISISSWDQKFSLSFHGIFRSLRRREVPGWGKGGLKADLEGKDGCSLDEVENGEVSSGGCLRRCNWITKFSDNVYVSFHDECWGVPVYNDSQLFELLALSGMLIDHNWTEILKRRDQYREVFAEFDHNVVAKMEEQDILGISCNKELMLAECRVRCIVENARCIQKVANEFGSFSGYIWGQVNHRPTVSRYKYPKSVPLRTPKSEAISRDLLKRGFRLVGPVIVYSFMQAAGLAIDHLIDCFRFGDCLSIVERSWGTTNSDTSV